MSDTPVPPPPPPPGFSPTSPAAVRRGAPWLRGTGCHADVVVSSRVRLARNLAGTPFVKKASREHRQRVALIAQARLQAVASTEKLAWVDLSACSQLDRTLLVERHLISKELARGEDPRGVAISHDEQISIMVNEEDHLRLQVIRSGLELSEALAQIDALDDRLEGTTLGASVPILADASVAGGPGGGASGLNYAFSPKYGYLTACPTNVGTGLRLSVMLHLPALKLTGEMEKMRRAARDMSLAVRGYYGESSEAVGDFFQISNQTTLGKSEQALLATFAQEIIPQVIHYEREARRKLIEKRRRMVEDQVLRALGALRYARLLTPEEATTLLSQVRLGILAGLITDVPEQTVNQLILLTQPAHLQRVLGREMDQGERREARADLVRQQLSV
ncbi:MAG: protein arginine kinase [Phycisphaerales bacterium]|nr:protein arginine kinase [Phycisphaerales bacterium]